MTTKTTTAHPPFDMNAVLGHLDVLGVKNVKVKKDSSWGDKTEWSLELKGEAVRIQETAHRSNSGTWYGTGQPTGKRSISVKGPGEWRNVRKFFCSKDGWDYPAIAEMVKFLYGAANDETKAAEGYETLVKEVHLERLTPECWVIGRQDKGPLAKLHFTHLNTRQVIAILKAAKDAGVENI